jgi:hypothetical protein
MASGFGVAEASSDSQTNQNTATATRKKLGCKSFVLVLLLLNGDLTTTGCDSNTTYLLTTTLVGGRLQKIKRQISMEQKRGRAGLDARFLVD